MTAFPRVTWDDIEAFEDRLDEAVRNGTPRDIEQGLRQAMRFIKNRAGDANLNMNHINNATSTAMRAFAEMAGRLRKVEAELAGFKQGNQNETDGPAEKENTHGSTHT